jgi:hypothetical protein
VPTALVMPLFAKPPLYVLRLIRTLTLNAMLNQALKMGAMLPISLDNPQLLVKCAKVKLLITELALPVKKPRMATQLNAIMILIVKVIRIPPENAIATSPTRMVSVIAKDSQVIMLNSVAIW